MCIKVSAAAAAAVQREDWRVSMSSDGPKKIMEREGLDHIIEQHNDDHE